MYNPATTPLGLIWGNSWDLTHQNVKCPISGADLACQIPMKTPDVMWGLGWGFDARKTLSNAPLVSAQTTRVWCHAMQPLGCVKYYITYYVITVYAYTTTMYTLFETLFKCYNK